MYYCRTRIAKKELIDTMRKVGVVNGEQLLQVYVSAGNGQRFTHRDMKIAGHLIQLEFTAYAARVSRSGFRR